MSATRRPVKKSAPVKKMTRPLQKAPETTEDPFLDEETENPFEDGSEELDADSEHEDDDTDPNNDDEEADVNEQVRKHAISDLVHNGVFTTEYAVSEDFTTATHLQLMRRVIEDAQNLGLHARPATAQRVKFNREKTKATYAVSVRER